MSSNSAERAFDVLEAIKQSSGGLTHSELSRILQIPKSSCTYLLASLEQKGVLVRNHDGRRYRIGPTILALAYGALRDMGFRSATEPALYRLVAETRLSATIAIMERDRVLVVDRVESPKVWMSGISSPFGAKVIPYQIRQREQREIGRELPAHSNSVGKVLLAYLAEDQLQAFLKKMELRRSTTHTIASKIQLLEELKVVKRRGYAIDREEQYVGVFALACPIMDDCGIVHAAVTVDGAQTDFDWSDPSELLPRVQEAAREIAKNPLFKSSYVNDLPSSKVYDPLEQTNSYTRIIRGHRSHSSI